MKTTHTLSAILTLAVFAIVMGFSAPAAEASFSVSYSSGDWSNHGGAKHYRKKHDRAEKKHYREKDRQYNRYNGFWRVRARDRRPVRYVSSRYHRRLNHLPRFAKYVWVGGHHYYFHAGVYYKPSPCGTYYIVVDDPHDYTVVEEKQVTQVYDDTVYESQQRDFVVHIRDNNGKLVTVRLSKSDDGYVGPQGEFYPEFPKVAQLKAMYAE